MISVCLAMLGWYVGARTLQMFVEHQMIRQLMAHERALLQINFVLLVLLMAPQHPILALSTIAMVLALPIFLSIIKSRWNERRFRIETVDLYDAMLMDVRSGLSARESIAISGQNISWSYQHREIVSYVLKNDINNFPNRGKTTLVRAREVSSILNSGSRVADRIKFYRDQWALIRKLERKIRSATQQSKAQSLVVSFLYIVVSGYQYSQNSRFLSSKWFILGSLMLMLGLLLIHRISRSFRWRV